MNAIGFTICKNEEAFEYAFEFAWACIAASSAARHPAVARLAIQAPPFACDNGLRYRHVKASCGHVGRVNL